MAFPTAITFHGVESSDLLRAEVIERTRALEHVLGDVLACRVVVAAEPRRARHGCHYGVHVRVAMPCQEIEAGGKPAADGSHQDPFLTVAETFEVLLERMQEFVRRRCLECAHYRGGHARTR